MKQPVTVHLSVRGGPRFNTPLCGTNAWRYQTSRLLDHVTCQWCVQEVKR